MALFNMTKSKLEFINKNNFSENEYKIASTIQRLRLQMLVHSFLYYRLGTSIISDYEFTERAIKLAKIQNDFPNICEKLNIYNNYFKNWDGSTGMHLPLNEPWIMQKAEYLLKLEGVKSNGIEGSDKKIQQSTRKANSKSNRGKTANKQRRPLF